MVSMVFICATYTDMTLAIGLFQKHLSHNHKMDKMLRMEETNIAKQSKELTTEKQSS